MQLGMIGLGRMGGNMVRRLMRAGHECVVYDVHPEAVKALAGEGAAGSDSLRAFVAALRPPRVVWMMVPAGLVDREIAELTPLLAPGDIVVDGGNSHYHDDIRRAAELAGHDIHYLDVGTSGGVFGLDRGYCLMIGGEPDVVERLDPLFATLAPGTDAAPATPGRDDQRGNRRARLSALRPGRRGAFREDGPQRHRVRDHGRLRRGVQHPPPRRRGARLPGCGRGDHAAQSPRALPVPARAGRDRRALAPGQRDRIVAARPHRAGAAGEPRPVGLQRAGVGFGRGPLDPRRGDRRVGARAGAERGAVRALLLARARPTSPASSCRPCATSSGDTRNEGARDDERRRGGGLAGRRARPLRGHRRPRVQADLPRPAGDDPPRTPRRARASASPAPIAPWSSSWPGSGRASSSTAGWTPRRSSSSASSSCSWAETTRTRRRTSGWRRRWAGPGGRSTIWPFRPACSPPWPRVSPG